MLTVSKGAIFMFLSWSIGNSCSPPCLPDSPSSMASLVLSDLAGWDPQCGCPAHAYWPFIVWETVICTTLSQEATSFPMADLGSHCFSPAGFPEPSSLQGAWLRSGVQGLESHFCTISAFPHPSPRSYFLFFSPNDAHWTSQNRRQFLKEKKKHSTRLYALHTPLLEA